MRLPTGDQWRQSLRRRFRHSKIMVPRAGVFSVLKLLANVRSAEPIIADIHRPSAPSTPQATVGFTLGSTGDEVEWHGGPGVAPFTRMTVFDSPAVTLHLEDNVTYLYTPADLALFGYVHAGIEGVRTLLQAEMNDRMPRQNPFLAAFTRGTDVYARIEGLSASTNVSEMDTLAVASWPSPTGPSTSRPFGRS